jgi:hypothetical protein
MRFILAHSAGIAWARSIFMSRVAQRGQISIHSSRKIASLDGAKVRCQ